MPETFVKPFTVHVAAEPFHDIVHCEGNGITTFFNIQRCGLCREVLIDNTWDKPTDEIGSMEFHYFTPGCFVAKGNDGGSTYVTDIENRLDNPCKSEA